MRCGKYFIALFTTVMLIVCIWSKLSHAEESTFDVRTKKPISGDAKIAYRYLDNKKKIAPKKISISQNKGKSKKLNKKKAVLLGKRDLKVQDIQAQIWTSGISRSGDKQIQGVQRLLYIILLTDNDASGNNRKNIDYLRCRTLIQTSDNIVKLAKLREISSENVIKLAKLKETGYERVSFPIKNVRL
jgi:hypothetical protein